MKVAVLIPVLNRPHRVEPLLQSLLESERIIPLQILFIVSRDDSQELAVIQNAAAQHLIVDWQPGRGDYAAKVNLAASKSKADWLLAGADDLVFKPGWADIAIAVAEESRKRFVATNDMANPAVMHGNHATHPLLHRSYFQLGTIDQPRKIYHEGYSHQCVDVEATETALYRDEFVFAQMSIVEHHHPIYPKKGVRVPMDSTYEKAMADGKEDLVLLHTRRHLWGVSNGTGRRRVVAQ